MENLPLTKIEKGVFMIASPEVEAGIFSRAVILVCEHNPSGSFGLVINKDLHLELPEEILNIDNLNNPEIQMRASGPVQTNQMMLLHTSNSNLDQTMEVCRGVYLGGDLKFLQKCVLDPIGIPMLLCFGYAGWGAGQLEREYLDGGWFLHPANKKYIFEMPANMLWKSLLRDMGGKYASLSMIPEDLSWN